MSEQTPENSHEAYTSQIDPAFSRAWNETFGDEDPAEAGQGAGEAPASGEGEAAPASPVVAPGQQPATAAGAAGGEAAPDAAAPGDAGGVPGAESPAEGTPAGQPAEVPSSASGARPFAELAPLLDLASQGVIENSQAALRQQAIVDTREQLDPAIIEAVEAHPMQLVGDTVPSVKGEGTIVLNNATEARDWQDAVKHIINKEVTEKTAALLQDAQPVLSTIQDSITLFRNNQDIMPGAVEYNPELTTRFLKMASPYLHMVDGKPIGFKVDVQPLLNQLREDMKANPPAPSTKQVQAAAQPRTPEGRFDAPQAGIPSKTGLSGSAEDDYSDFWGALGMPGMTI